MASIRLTNEYQIVIPRTAGECICFAAEELQYFISRSANLSLPIVTEPERESMLSIFIGKASQKKLVEKSILSNDGYRLMREESSIYIVGKTDRGCLYGVYGFLEYVLGIRFLTRECTYIPELNEIVIGELNVSENPTFAQRMFLAEPILFDGLFAARKKLTAPYGVNSEKHGGGYLSDWNRNEPHSMFHFADPKVYGKEHPDWYSEDNGQLCLTNGITDDDRIDESIPDSCIKKVIENLKHEITEKKNVKYFMIGQQDCKPACDCERCRQSYVRNGGKSGTLMVFINLIAREIEKWQKDTFPDREIYLVTFAYQWSAIPPVVKTDDNYMAVNKNVIPYKNVYVLMAIIDACFFHDIHDPSCPLNKTTAQILDGWSSICNRLMIWDYCTNFSNHLWYFPNLRIVKSFLTEYEKLGVQMVLTQGGPREAHYYKAELDCYLYSKMLWDPHQDMSLLVTEFNELYFTKNYASYANRFLEMMENHFSEWDRKKGYHTDLYDNYGQYFHSKNYPIEFINACENLILEAIEKVRKDETLDQSDQDVLEKRFIKILVTPQMMKIVNYDIYGCTDKKTYVENFLNNLKAIKMKDVSEGLSIEQFREKYNLL